jgi:hypothetical protein
MIDGVYRASSVSLRELPFGRPAGVPAAPVPRGWQTARPLFCPCGKAQPEIAGLCRSCYERHRYSRRHFGGLRFEALVRDRFRCRVCASPRYPVVHRRSEQPQLETFVTLCASCLGVVMYLDRPASWLPPLLFTLWREQHPDVVLQHQFEFSGWQAPPAHEQIAPAPLPPASPLMEPSQGTLFR